MAGCGGAYCHQKDPILRPDTEPDGKEKSPPSEDGRLKKSGPDLGSNQGPTD